MSFFGVASYSNDKGSNISGQRCEDFGADFFDQFLTFDPIDNEGPDYPHLANSTHLERPKQQNGTGGASSGWTDTEVKASDNSSWHLDISQKPSSSHHASGQFYSESSGRAVVSDSELLSLEDISLGSPVSPLLQQHRAHSLPSPASPNVTITRRRARTAGSAPKTFRKAVSFDKSLRSPIKKTPKMVRGSQSFQGSLYLTSKCHFDFEHPMSPLSPPQSTRISDASDASATKFTKESNHDVFDYDSGLHHFSNRSNEYDTPLATPVLDGQHSRKASLQQPYSDPMNFPRTPQFYQASGSWSQIPGSSEFSSFGTPAIHSPGTEAPMWWNHASEAPMAQPPPTALHIQPQRATRSLANQLQIDLPFESNGLGCSPTSKMPGGLMISMPESAVQSFVITSPDMQSPHNMSQQSYFGHCQPTHHEYPPPPHPHIGGAASYPQHSSHMHESRHPIRHSESPSPKSTSSAFHVRKSQKAKSSAKTPRTPNGGDVDFVNFTPSDSRKILTGVAPSGSSKTKARREKEAVEKRRKFSIAALRAVRAAGGDVESLVEQGLFV